MTNKIFNLIILLLFSCSVVLAEVWVDLQWDYDYISATLPDQSGSIIYSDGNEGEFTLAGSSSTYEIIYENDLNRNVLHISTLGNDSGFYFSDSSVPPSQNVAFNSEQGYTVQIKIKLNSTDSASPSACVFSFEEATAGVARYWSLNLQSDPDGSNQKVGLSNTSDQISISSGWHTYRILAHKNGVNLYIDGSPYISMSTSYMSSIDNNLWRFGDLTTTADSDYELAQLSIYSGGTVLENQPSSGWLWPDLDWDYDYSPVTDPSFNGSIKYSDGSTDIFTISGSSTVYQIVYDDELAKNVFYINTIGNDTGFFFQDEADAPGSTPDFNSEIGYTVEIQAKLIETETENSSVCRFYFEEATTGITRHWSFCIITDYDNFYDPDTQGTATGKHYAGFINSSSTDWVEITPGWHTFRITAEDSNEAIKSPLKLYIDGELKVMGIGGYLLDQPIDKWGFGDFTLLDDSEYKLGYIRIYSGGAVVSPRSCDEIIETGSVLLNDINKNCEVDFDDLAQLVNRWLDCYIPGDSNCLELWGNP